MDFHSSEIILVRKDGFEKNFTHEYILCQEPGIPIYTEKLNLPEVTNMTAKDKETYLKSIADNKKNKITKELTTVQDVDLLR